LVGGESSAYSTLTGFSTIGLGTKEYVSLGLDKVRAKVIQELQRLARESKGLEKLDESRLQLYRQSFENFVGSFRIYRPLLSAIKAEYDNAVAESSSNVLRMRPKLVRYEALTSDYDLDLQMIYHRNKEETQPIRERLEKIRATTEDTNRRTMIAEDKIADIRAEQEKLRAELDEAQEAQHVLVTSLRSWERGLDDLHREAEQSDRSVWSIKQKHSDTVQKTLQCRQNTARGRDIITLKQKELEVVVDEIITLMTKNQLATKAVRDAENLASTEKRKVKMLAHQHTASCADAVDRSRADTPRPIWEDCQVTHLPCFAAPLYFVYIFASAITPVVCSRNGLLRLESIHQTSPLKAKRRSRC
jgi:chromosome segregation ATPase